MVDRLPGARVVNAVLWALLVIGIAAAAIWPKLQPAVSNDRVTLSLLQSEQMSFLVVRRTRTQIVIDHSQSDWLGQWRGVLWATISWRWGLDMKKLTPADIRQEGSTVVIHLGEPELLDFALEPGSIGFISKSTALPKLEDFFGGGTQRQLLETQLREGAMKFAQEQRMLPTHQEIVQQLNDASAILERAAGTKLRFE